MTVLDSYKKLIDTVINQDEGGWKLTPASESDPSGGWTFAGATKTSLTAWWAKAGAANHYSAPVTHTDMAHYIAGNFDEVKEEIYQFYMDEYVDCLGHTLASTVHPALLSCAVNCGVGTAVELYRDASHDDRKFLSLWHQHYIGLVVENAKAWHDWAGQLSDTVFDAHPVPDAHKFRPTTFRAPNALGWFNRVEKYRDLVR